MTKSPQESKNKSWNRTDWSLLVINAAIFLAVFLTFNGRLPNVIGSHFNAYGEQDGTMPKWNFWLLNAVLTIGLPLLIKALRYADPRRSNYAKFEGAFDLMRWALALFLQGVLLLVVFHNLGYEIPIVKVLLGGIGVLWILFGNRMSQLRSNFFVGIRTPWALMDEDNWRQTHRIGARTWVAAGLVMFAASWFVNAAWCVYVLLGCALISAFIPFVYSYLLFARKQKEG